MNLQEIDRLKARAVDALARGAHPDADALFEAIAPEYERHGFTEGLLVLRYDQLLAVLGTQDRRRIQAVLDALGHLLLDADRASPSTQAVAKGLGRLLASGLPGVDHEATQAVAALAADLVGTIHAPVGALDPDELPAADALARLDATTAAALATAAASASWGRAGGPAWLGAVRRWVGPPKEPSVEANATWTEVAAAWRRGDGLKAFPPLVGLVESALETSPALAAEWLVALDDLEAQGLPDRVDFLPGLPRERARQVAVCLFGRLAEAVGAVRGGARLAGCLRDAAVARAAAWQHTVDARRQRGSGQAEDVRREAIIAQVVADALVRRGDFEGAAARLEPSVRRARRDALDDRVASAQLILLSAVIAERDARYANARDRYRIAAQTALPNFLEAADADRRRALVDRVVEQGEAARALVAARALAGLFRLGDTEVSLEAARDAIAQARMASDARAVSEARLVVELTAAASGSADAGLNAAEAAAALGRPDAAALAHCLRARRLEGDEAVEAWGMVATACERAGATAITWRLEALLAERHRRLGDLDRLDLHARRLGELLEQTPPGADDPLRRFLQFEQPDVADLAARLVELGRSRAARRLLAGWRRRGAPRGHDAGGVATALEARVRGTWVGAEPGPDLRAVLAEVTPPEGPATLDGVPRLEFATFESRTVICLAKGDGDVRLAHATVGRAALTDAVDAVRSLLEDDGAAATDPDVARLARPLARALIEPFEAELGDGGPLLIAPDGPLHRLCFGILPLSDGRPLALRHPVARVVERVRRRPAGPLPPPTGRILGDAATTRDLRFATLAGPNAPYLAVDVRHGTELAPEALPFAAEGARALYLVGAVDEAGIALQDDAPSVPLPWLSEVIAAAGTPCVVLSGEGEPAALRAAVHALAAGAAAVCVRRSGADASGLHVCEFLADAVAFSSPAGLMEALASARYAAIHAGRGDWTAWGLYVADG